MTKILLDEGGRVFQVEAGGVDLFERPVPPADLLEAFANLFRKAPAEEARGVAADDGVGRDVFDDIAVRRDDRAVANGERAAGGLQMAAAADPDVGANRDAADSERVLLKFWPVGIAQPVIGSDMRGMVTVVESQLEHLFPGDAGEMPN